MSDRSTDRFTDRYTDSLDRLGHRGFSGRSTGPTYVRTRRTNGEPWSPSRDISPLVTRTRAYDDDPDITLAAELADLIERLSTPPARMPVVRSGERDEIHPWVRKAIYRRDGWACAWCGKSWHDDMLQLDHIVPWSAGGTDSSDNLRTLCRPCNEDRSNYVTDTYARVTPVGMCDDCWVKPSWKADPADPRAGVLVEQEFTPDIPPTPIFCGRCKSVTTTTERRRIT